MSSPPYSKNVDLPDARLLGRLARYAVIMFVALIALDQLDIGGNIIRESFLIILAGIVLGLALAFGLEASTGLRLCSNGGGRRKIESRPGIAISEALREQAGGLLAEPRSCAPRRLDLIQ
jgi:hypothetical protein